MMKVYYYNSYEDDIIESKNQYYKLPTKYKWIHTNIFYRLLSFLVYILVLIIAFFYTKFVLHIKIKKKKVLKKEKSYFIYCNHTLTLGDVLNPFIICFPKRPRIICSSANLGIPIIGKILPIAGAIPIPDNIHDMIKFNESVNFYVQKGNPIFIYPEAHLWPYATIIRDFPITSFHYPIVNQKKVFVSTTTYSKRKHSKKPKITIYIDELSTSNINLSKKENIKMLHDNVYSKMVDRSKLNTYEYIKYKKKD